MRGRQKSERRGQNAEVSVGGVWGLPLPSDFLLLQSDFLLLQSEIIPLQLMPRSLPLPQARSR